MVKHSIQQLNINKRLKLVNLKTSDFDLSFCSIWFKHGFRDDSKEKQGLAHFFEHLFGVKIKNDSNINRLQYLDSIGIINGAFTTVSSMRYYNIQSGESFLKSLDVMFENINNSIFDEELFNKEKDTIKQEDLDNKDNANDYLWRLNYKSIWPESTLSNDIFGDVDKIDLDDFKNLMDYIYKNTEIVILTMSNLDISEIYNQISDKIYNLNDKNYNKNIKAEYFKGPIALNIEKRELDKVIVSINYKTTDINNVNDYIILDFIKHYMTSGWNSVIVDSLRLKENIIYWPYSDNTYFSDTGFMNVNFSCNKENYKKALNLFDVEINNIKLGNIDNDRLIGIRNYLKSELFLYYNDIKNLMIYYGSNMILSENVLTIDEYINKLVDVSIDDIKLIANKYFIDKNKSVVLISDIS